VGITSIFVTHDQEEAFALSDRIAVLRDGRLQQVGTPEELYRLPTNPFVAAFVGRANFLEGRILGREGGEGLVEVHGGARWNVRVHGAAGERVRVMVRPEALRLAAGRPAANGTGLAGEVLDRRFAGSNTVYRVRVAGTPELFVAIPGDGNPLDGEVTVFPEDAPPLHAFPVEGG